MRAFLWIVLPSLTLSVAPLVGQRSPEQTPSVRSVVQGTLIAEKSQPFHLEASLTVGQEQRPYGNVVMDWAAPNKYRRVIATRDFQQTLTVNGDKVAETEAPEYFPLQLRTLVTAMVDPAPILAMVRSGDRVVTKSNGGANEAGITCFDLKKTMCVKDPKGLRETVAASGHAVQFGRYEVFHGQRIARELSTAARLGETPLNLTVTKLIDLKSEDKALFEVPATAASGAGPRFVVLDEKALREQLNGDGQIIWPQPLDGAEKGTATFYVSFDHAGKVREVQQLYTVNERTNDSAKSQLSKWTFKPLTQAGVPAQGEGVLSFEVNTRAWGPANPLTDEEVRKLATGKVQPEVEPGKFASGTTYSVWAAVDSEGKLIEVMAGDGPNELFVPCLQAVQKWQFSPVMENGQPRPYRANVIFRLP